MVTQKGFVHMISITGKRPEITRFRQLALETIKIPAFKLGIKNGENSISSWHQWANIVASESAWLHILAPLFTLS